MTYGKEEDASEFYNGLIQFLVDKNADRYEQCMRTSDWAALGNSSFPTFCVLSCTLHVHPCAATYVKGHCTLISIL